MTFWWHLDGILIAFWWDFNDFLIKCLWKLMKFLRNIKKNRIWIYNFDWISLVYISFYNLMKFHAIYEIWSYLIFIDESFIPWPFSSFPWCFYCRRCISIDHYSSFSINSFSKSMVLYQDMCLKDSEVELNLFSVLDVVEINL